MIIATITFELSHKELKNKVEALIILTYTFYDAYSAIGLMMIKMSFNHLFL